MILDDLRREARAAHGDSERRLGLLEPGLTLAAYRVRLCWLYGFFAPLEMRIEATPGAVGLGVDFAARRKAPLLAADLRALGLDAAALPLAGDRPPLDEPARALGAAWVLEGSTLGGRVLAPRLATRLGVGPASGASFFASYGASVDAMWHAFCDALVGWAVRHQAEGAVVAAARETFEEMVRWLDERSDREAAHAERADV